jgi:serine/threonine protein kinase
MSKQADQPTQAADPFSEMLAAYDEALAGGGLNTPEPGATLPPDVRARMQEACACLRLLERAWPRARPAAAPAAPWGQVCNLSENQDKLQTCPHGTDVTVRFGRFELVRELGRGGHGIVLLARDPVLGRDVAVKVLRPEYHLTPEMRRRFLREARAAAALDHPHIIPVYEAGEEGPVCYIASANCDGPTLAQWLAGREAPVPARTAARLVLALAEAVAHAHAHGILHRDLKPANVLLAPRPPGEAAPAGDELEFVPRLTDFGLAKFLDPEPAAGPGEDGPAEPEAPAGYGLARARAAGTDVTASTAGAVGTPAYMSPEQVRGEPPSPATDVWALGVILFQLLTGKPPFAAGTRAELAHQVLEEAAPSPQHSRRDLDPALAAVCLRCLEKGPARRYSSAAALADDLRRWLSGGPRWLGPWRWLRRHPFRASVLAGLAAVVTLVAVLALRPPDPDRPVHEMRKALAAGQTVTLIGETGPPAWFRCPAGEATWQVATAADGSFTLNSWSTAMVELLPATPTTAYRLSAEVCHRTGARSPAGLYIGHSIAGAGPKPVHWCCDLTVLDALPKGVPGGQAQLNLRCYRPPALAASSDMSALELAAANLVPVSQVPGGWRTLALEVRPDRVRAFADGCLVRDMSRAKVAERLHTLRAVSAERLATFDFPAYQPDPDFAAREGLGLYVNVCLASFRNVQIEPLPDAP